MSDLRSRLRNLRAASRPIPRNSDIVPPETGYYSSPAPLEVLAPGELHVTPHGTSYVVRTLHAHDHVHGENELNGWLSQNLAGAAIFTQDRRLANVDPRRCLFLDTETTGLNAGSGTLVFLVGVGSFTDDSFEVRQFFLRDPAEEAAMLHALNELMATHDALITFNGRSFDVPMLAARFIMNRQRWPTERWPNLDLLYPARRLWKRRLVSCRLSALEGAILGVQRTGEDVPGYLIPQLYYEYLHSGDARQMRRVMYHNLYDVLSMVTLATHLCSTFTRADVKTLPRDDLLSLARWYEHLDLFQQAESVYVAALDASRHDYDRRVTLESLAGLYKRQDRRAEAEPLWQALATLSPANPEPCIELAKYHEWTTGDLAQALTWTDAARQANAARPPSFDQQSVQDDIQKRRDRLQQKLAK